MNNPNLNSAAAVVEAINRLKYVERLMQVLRANNQKDFVQRILNPYGQPQIANPDGSFSTHLMSTAESDGRFYAYPLIMRGEGGGLVNYGDDAFRRAIDSGEFIEFPSQEEADWFSKNYKMIWDKKMR